MRNCVSFWYVDHGRRSPNLNIPSVCMQPMSQCRTKPIISWHAWLPSESQMWFVFAQSAEMRLLPVLPLLVLLLALAVNGAKKEGKDLPPGHVQQGLPSNNVIENVFKYPVGASAQIIDWTSTNTPAGVYDAWFEFTTTIEKQNVYMCFAFVDAFQYIDVYQNYK
jgi:hypothetical protein